MLKVINTLLLKVNIILCVKILSFLLNSNYFLICIMISSLNYRLLSSCLICKFGPFFPSFFFSFFPFVFISWRLITSQYCSGFCHTLTWISHGFTCVPHPDTPSHLPLPPILLFHLLVLLTTWVLTWAVTMISIFGLLLKII